MVDHPSWKSKPNLKCAHPSTLETEARFSNHLLRPTGDATLCANDSSCKSLSDEKKHKRMRPEKGRDNACRFAEETSCTCLKIHPVPSSLMNNSLLSETMSESSRKAETNFSVNVGPTNTMTDTLVYVVSSDDEDALESNTPDLNLALGEKSNRDKFPSPKEDYRTETPASLSLSLTFAASDKVPKPNSETEPLLPDKPCNSTSFWGL